MVPPVMLVLPALSVVNPFPPSFALPVSKLPLVIETGEACAPLSGTAAQTTNAVALATFPNNLLAEDIPNPTLLKAPRMQHDLTANNCQWNRWPSTCK